MMGTLASAEELRFGLRRLAKAVVVITANHEGSRYAMAATAVSELSMDPPSLLACVNQSASLAVPLCADADFAINILHSTHGEISTLCSGSQKGEARFATGNWFVHESGLPYLEDAQATFFCRQSARFVHGTHLVAIGDVFALLTSGEVDPLVYLDGRYAKLPESAHV
jgi:flavin reductase (DIM6/NTAB) family NADH-FMN oxidoreductase RutF